jgi:hypothetical protein
MKRIIFLCCLAYGSLIAQSELTAPCSPNGVTTNPDNPINPIHNENTPSTVDQNEYINTYDFRNWFDWTLPNYPLYFDKEAANPTTFILNPFMLDAGQISELYDQDRQDYFPEDGWELISFHLGVDKEGNPDPENIDDAYMILYNKYRALLRVFVAIDQDKPGNLIEIELRFDGVGYNTALLASLDEVQQPLKSFNPLILASSSQEFYNATNFRHWNYADFPVNYDPCTCIRTKPIENGEIEDLGNSELMLSVSVIGQAKIELEGTSNGTIKPLEKQATQTNGVDDWNSFYGPVKKVSGSIEAGKKAYKSFSGFKSDVESEAGAGKASTGFDNVAKLLTKEIPALEMVPYVSEALAIVDFFVTGGKKEDATKIGPMAMNLEHSFSGAIYTTYPYIGNRGIFTPGSEFSPKGVITQIDPQDPTGLPVRPVGDSRYPYYNEILGVYTLLEKPEVKVWKGITSEIDWDQDEQTAVLGFSRKNIRHGLKITPGSIKVAINPSADLILKEGYVQINYIRADQGTGRSAKFFSIEQNDIVDDTSWTSPLIPLQSIAESALLFEVRAYNRPSQTFNYKNGDLSCSTILVFENSNGDRFLHKSTWDTEVTEVKNDNGDDFWDWEESSFNESGVVPSTSDQWPFPGGDYGYYGAPNNLEFTEQPWRPLNNGSNYVNFQGMFFIPNPAILKAKQNILLKNILTGGTGSQGSNPSYVYRYEDNFSAGNSITVEKTTIRPNTTLQISPLGINNPQPFNTLNIATAEEISSICESSTYLGSKQVNYKQENYLQDAPYVAKEQLNFITYPNPARESVLILLENSASYPAQLEVTLVDVSGNPVQSQIVKSTELNGNKYPLDLQGLAPGMYVLRVNSEKISGQQKIVKL